MGVAERVADVDVGQRGEVAGELVVVFLLARMKPEVLQQEHLAGPHLLRHAPGLRSRGGGGQGAFLFQKPGQPFCDGAEGVSEVGFSLGPADVGADDDPRALVQQVVDGGKRRPDAGRRP